MSEERRLKEANEKLLSNICNEVVKAAGSGNNSQPLDTVKQIISEHKVCGYDPKSVVLYVCMYVCIIISSLNQPYGDAWE